jgi:hypothetical protein
LLINTFHEQLFLKLLSGFAVKAEVKAILRGLSRKRQASTPALLAFVIIRKSAMKTPDHTVARPRRTTRLQTA